MKSTQIKIYVITFCCMIAFSILQHWVSPYYTLGWLYFLHYLAVTGVFIPRGLFHLLIIYLFNTVIPLIIPFEIILRLLIVTIAIREQSGFKPVELESIPEIDQLALRDCTENLKSLGFHIAIDVESTHFANTFSRIFVHPELYCYASLSPNTEYMQRMICIISSGLDQGWSISISSKPPDRTSAVGYAFLNLPRALGIRIPGATPAQMLQTLLELRQQMMEDLKISVIPDLSWETYWKKGQQNRKLIKRAIWRKSILWGILEAFLYSRSPKLEWYGEYAKFIKRRKRRAS